MDRNRAAVYMLFPVESGKILIIHSTTKLSLHKRNWWVKGLQAGGLILQSRLVPKGYCTCPSQDMTCEHTET